MKLVQSWNGTWFDLDSVQLLEIYDFGSKVELCGYFSAAFTCLGEFGTIGEAESARDELAARINAGCFNKWRAEV